jgi:S-(hydroxymethyl)glutathione dehydrogenase / alcohol dehydrogenase
MMKAAVLVQQNEPLLVKEFKVQKPVGHQVLVRIHMSGICGAQINEIRGIKGPDAFLPHLMGHEGSGVVESVGEQVTKIAAGDRVVLHWRKASGGEGPFPKYEGTDGQTAGGGFVTSFANRALIAENRVTKIDADIPFDVACLFGCGISTGYGIVENELKLQPGASLAVIGSGGVGLNVIQAAAFNRAAEIIAVDRVAGPKETLARTMGATQYLQVESPDGLHAALRQIRKAGFDAIVDTTGDVRLMQESFKSLSKNGTLMLVGQPRLGAQLVIDPALDLFTGKRLRVSEGGEFNPDRDMNKLAGLYRQDPAAMRRVITHSYKLDQINDAITTMQSGTCGRVLINMETSS